MVDYTPFKDLEISFLPKDRLDSFVDYDYIANKHYSLPDLLEPSHLVSESRRLIMLMSAAAKLVIKQPPETESDLFIGTSREITQNAGQGFKHYVESYPELNASIDHFRLKLKAEERAGADYLDLRVKALEGSELYRISKGQYFTPRMFAKRLISRAKDDYKPIPLLEPLGTYFDYQFHLREQRMEQERKLSNRPPPKDDGPMPI